MLLAEVVNELPIGPVWFGLISFALLMALLVGTLVFGKGRPHA